MYLVMIFFDVLVILFIGEMVLFINKEEGCDWKMVVVYCGKYCLICIKFLNKLEDYKGCLCEFNIDLVVVSGDSKV